MGETQRLPIFPNAPLAAKNFRQDRKQFVFFVDRFLGIGLDRSRLRYAPGRGVIGRHIETIADVSRGACVDRLSFP